jgi:hypothetical protein
VFVGVGFARGMVMIVPVMGVVMFMPVMGVFMRMLMTVMIMMFRMSALVGMGVVVFGLRVIFMRLGSLCRIGGGVLDDLALDPLATAAAALVAVARTAAAVTGAVFGFFFGLTMGALVGFDQRLAIGDRNLIIIRVDFAEGQKAVAVAAIFDEGGLQ